MHSAELSDGVVAVLVEDPLVEVVGSFEADRGVNVGVAVEFEVAHELIEEQTAQTLGRARVPREEGALHDLGQVDQREDRTLEIGEIPPKYGHLGVGEIFGNVGVHGNTRLEAKLAPTGGRWRPPQPHCAEPRHERPGPRRRRP